MYQLGRFLCALLILCTLAGCEKNSQLFNDLPEKDVNDMLYILQKTGIKATKVAEKSGFGINVPSSEMYRSMALLRQHGYPKEKFKTLDDIFPSDSLMSSAMADTLRYYKVIADGLSESISQIDGIISVRVHIVPSENQNGSTMSKKNKTQEASGASVFIKYNPDYAIDSYVANIKSMVSSSVSGLNYNNVGVFLFPETLSIYTLEPDKLLASTTKNTTLLSGKNNLLIIILGAIFVLSILFFALRNFLKKEQ